MVRLILIVFCLALYACNWQVPNNNEGIIDTLSSEDSLAARIPVDSSVIDTAVLTTDNVRVKDTSFIQPTKGIDVGNVDPAELVAFAKTMIGVPYVWGSTNPAVGFDCSGFITHVFNHFRISVPRSSIDFTNVGKHIQVEEAKAGDLILFTGTNPMETHVGHMGIVVENNKGALQFIHSTSGKAMGVTITPFSDYYKTRFVKVIRVFPSNDKA